MNIVGYFSEHDECITVSSKRNLLIHHTDILVPITSIANATHCMRRPRLSQLMRSQSDFTRALVWGSILHEIMQRCLSTQRWDAESIEEFVDECIRKDLTKLVQIDAGVEEAKVEINKRAIGLKTFGKNFLGEVPKVVYFPRRTNGC